MLLLTWWTWYIWSHTAVALLQAGYDVVILDNLSNSSKKVLNHIETITGKSVPFYEVDIRDIYAIENVFKESDIEWVIHFAWLKAVWESCDKPYDYYKNNVVWSTNLFEIMEKYNCKNIIFSSTATVYAPDQNLPFTEGTKTGETMNPYATSKLIIENILRDLSNHKNFKAINLRYFNPIGAHESWLIWEDPNDIPNNLLPYIMKVAAWELQELSVFWNNYDTIDGTWVRDYIHVEDLANCHMQAWKWLKWESNTAIFENINIWTGKGTSVLEIIKTTEDVINKKLPFKITRRRTGDMPSTYCSPEKAYSLLGWRSKKTIKQAICDSWNFIQKNN